MRSAAVGSLMLLAGCAPSVEFTLRQSAAPPGQQQLKLKSAWGYWHKAEDGGIRCLIAAPADQMYRDTRDFVLYLSAPGLQPSWEISQHLSTDSAAAFLVQDVGALRGKSVLDSGTVEVKRNPFNPSLLSVNVRARSRDGAALLVVARLAENELELRAAERKYAADVAALRPSSTIEAAALEASDSAASDSP